LTYSGIIENETLTNFLKMKTIYVFQIILFICCQGIALSAQVKIPQESLVAYYPFDSDFNDHSGNNYNGKVKEALLTGSVNKACYFNGRNASIEVPNVEPLKTVKQLTISCWICPFSAKAYDSWICKANDRKNNSQWRLSFSQKCTKQVQLVIYNTDWVEYNFDFKFDPKKWYHMVYLIDNIEHKATIYIDGKSFSKFTIADLKTSGGPLLMGYQMDDKTFYNGMLDETLIYNRILNDKEILGLYDNFKNTEKANVEVIKTASFSQDAQYLNLRMDTLDKLMWNKVHAHSLAGVEYLVANKTNVFHHQAVGYRDMEKTDTLQKSSLFRIACTARPFTVISVLMLAEKGLISLNDPISKYIPEFREMKVLSKDGPQKLVKANREITIYDLLVGQSGIDYIPEYYQNAGVFADTNSLKNVVTKIASIPLAYQPGEGYGYGFTTVPDFLVEVVTGKPFNEFLKQNLFIPLEMFDTDFFVPNEKRNRFVTSYTFDHGKLTLMDTANCKNLKNNVLPHTVSMVSTAMDYLKFARMLLNKGRYKNKTIISEKYVELMTSNHLPDNLLGSNSQVSDRGWGMFGWVANECTQNFPAGTYGKDGGNWTSLFWIDKENELIGIIFLQTNRNYSIIPDFYKAVYNKK
jgi:CubicO group peptidase (beta-lactamase class C family)